MLYLKSLQAELYHGWSIEVTGTKCFVSVVKYVTPSQSGWTAGT